MSYEGFMEYICPNGHYYTGDEYSSNESCPYCHKESIFENSVDQTNCSGNGNIKIEVARPGVLQTCNLGHQHETSTTVIKPVTDKDGFILQFHECTDCGHPGEHSQWHTNTHISSLKVTPEVKKLWGI